MPKITSIVDVPKPANIQDDFGINKYQKGLVEFIQDADTPLTIAIQGEWGSGKTSLMNSLQDALCGEGKTVTEIKNAYYSIWINTWQYSLMSNREETLVAIVSSISTQVMQIISKRHEGVGQKIASGLFRFISKSVKAAATIAADKVAGSGELIDMILEREEANQTINKLRNDLQTAIDDCLKKDEEKKSPMKGFLFFIDDLDRIDPPVAVEILELLKNIFDLEKCIFILAIDYDVVVKGLKPKFGELTDKNEREFRSFFDKIIQMPFSMPVASYEINEFLMNKLKNIRYLSEEQAAKEELKQKFTALCNLSVGTNPRSLKRLLNTVSLITIISNVEEGNDEHNKDDDRLLMNFGLICIQIAYPSLYKALTMESSFTSWNEKLARQMKLRPLNDLEIKKLDDSEEFDEPWEKILFRICESDNYLSNKALQISQLFNMLKKLLPEGEELGSLIGELLALSSVTDLQVGDNLKKQFDKRPVLQKLAGEIMPLLISRKRDPYTNVGMQSKRIQSNIYINYTVQNNKYATTVIGLTVVSVKNCIALGIWESPWAFKSKSNNMQADLTSAGLADKFIDLKNAFKELQRLYPHVYFFHPEIDITRMAKGNHVPVFAFHIYFDDLDALMVKENLEKAADFITDYMQFRLKLSEMAEAYTNHFKE